MRTDLIRTKLREIEENLVLISKHLPDSYNDFSNLGLVKDGIYKRCLFSQQFIKS